jgi:hypothetical protein
MQSGFHSQAIEYRTVIARLNPDISGIPDFGGKLGWGRRD